MQTFNFCKMHGAGNDFIVCNDVPKSLQKEHHIRFLCDRFRGIGADGIIFLSTIDSTQTKDATIKMAFYNSDGSRASMCGNGLRCATYYAHTMMNFPKIVHFVTDSGELEGEYLGNFQVRISLHVNTPPTQFKLDDTICYGVNTGVPHLVIKLDSVDALKNCDIVKTGSFFRYHKHFSPTGTNVNCVAIDPQKNIIHIRTYERGVENETQACGTGCGATGIIALQFWQQNAPVTLQTVQGDLLYVSKKNNQELSLTGPVALVFSGSLNLEI